MRALLPELFRAAPPPSAAEACPFTDATKYATDYARLGELLGEYGKTPPPDESEFLRAMLQRGRPGTVGPDDYRFLTAFVSLLAPPRLLEIGTLTGFSAAIMAAALYRQYGNASFVRVDTIDVRAQCAVEETRPTGFEVAELVPSVASMVHVHVPHDSSFVSKLMKRDELSLAFIDAAHRHPYPLLDLMRIAPFLRSGAWIILHDIRWGTIGRKAAEAGQKLQWPAAYGAEWLFDYWPFRKISGGNIGAVQLPSDKRALLPFALRLGTLPFEVTDKTATRMERELFVSLADLL